MVCNVVQARVQPEEAGGVAARLAVSLTIKEEVLGSGHSHQWSCVAMDLRVVALPCDEQPDLLHVG